MCIRSISDEERARNPPLHLPGKEPSAVPRPRKTPVNKPGAIGERIRKARLARGLTQTELGKRIGVSQRMVTYYEVRGVSPTPELLIKLAHALEVPVEELIGEKPRTKAPADTPESIHLWRRLKKLEHLRPNDRKTVLRMIDLLAEQTQRRKAS
jgi:transcriptional regulator with XRE-family HTH domain